jgi:hypothetical protein
MAFCVSANAQDFDAVVGEIQVTPTGLVAGDQGTVYADFINQSDPNNPNGGAGTFDIRILIYYQGTEVEVYEYNNEEFLYSGHIKSKTEYYTFANSGFYTIQAEIYDINGLDNGWQSANLFDSKSESINVQAPQNPPAISRDDPSQNQDIALDEWITFSVDVQDEDGDLFQVLWYIDDVLKESTPVSGSYDGTMQSLQFIQEGNFEVRAEAEDQEGNRSNPDVIWYVSVTSPNAPPTINMLEPSSDIEVYSGETVTISWDGDDPDNDLTYVNLFYDDNDYYSDGIIGPIAINRPEDGSYEWSTYEYPPGVYRIGATITDNNHQERRDYAPGTVTIQPQTESPVISRQNPSQYIVSADIGETVTFEAYITDNDCDFSGADWYLGGEFKETVFNEEGGCDGDNSWNYTFMDEGSYIVEAQAFDHSGNYSPSPSPAIWQVNVGETDQDEIWYKSPCNPIMTSNQNPSYPTVIHTGGEYEYIMYFDKYSPPQHIEWATSPDGVTWTEQGALITPGMNGQFDWHDISVSQVFYNENEGEYWMYYGANDGSQWREIGLAASPDCINWTDHGEVFRVSDSGWDYYNIGSPKVVWDESANLYYMLYVGGSAEYGLGLASSTDGFSFSRVGSAPVINQGSGTDFDANGVHRVNAFYKEGDNYICYYSGRNSSNILSIGKAHSVDLTNGWIKDGQVFAANQSWEGGSILNASMVEVNGIRTLYYQSSSYQFGLAQIEDMGENCIVIDIPPSCETESDHTQPYSPDDCTVGLWHLDECQNAAVYDESNYENHGTVNGSPDWVTGKFGCALNSNYTTIPNSPELCGMIAITIEAWINIDTYGSNHWNYLVQKEGSYHFYIVDDGMPFERRMFVSLKTSDGQQNLYSENEIPLDQWVHVAAVYDGSELSFYINGQLNSSTTATGAINNTTGPLQIGGVNGIPMHGSIDEVRISNVAREYEGSYQPPIVNIIEPNGGEKWAAEEMKFISWTIAESIVDQVDVYLSRDGGSSWDEHLATIVDGSSSYEWQVTGTESYNCRVKVVASNEYGEFEDVSDDLFVIYENDLLQPIIKPSKFVAKSGVEIIFDGSLSTSSLGLPLYYAWTTSDHPDPQIGKMVSYSFETTGTKAVTLTIENSEGETASETINVYIIPGTTLDLPDYAEDAIIPGAISYLDRILESFVIQPDESKLPGVNVILGRGTTDDPTGPSTEFYLSYLEENQELSIIDNRDASTKTLRVLDLDDLDPDASGVVKYEIKTDPTWTGLNEKLLWVYVDLAQTFAWQEYSLNMIIDYDEDYGHEESRTMERAYNTKNAILNISDYDEYIALSRSLWGLYQAETVIDGDFKELGNGPYDLDGGLDSDGYEDFQHDVSMQAVVESFKSIGTICGFVLNTMSIVDGLFSLGTSIAGIPGSQLELVLNILPPYFAAVNSVKLISAADGCLLLPFLNPCTTMDTWVVEEYADLETNYAGEYYKIFLNNRTLNYYQKKDNSLPFDEIPVGYIFDKNCAGKMKSGWNLITIFAKGPTENNKDLQFCVDLVSDNQDSEEEVICKNIALGRPVELTEEDFQYFFSITELVFWIPDDIINQEGPLLFRLTAYERNENFDALDDYFADMAAGLYDEDNAYILQDHSLSFTGTQSFIVHSPVVLTIVDTYGGTMTDTSSSIPGTAYNTYDMDGDGDTEEIYSLPFISDESYAILITPRDGVQPSDSFKIEWSGIHSNDTLTIVNYTQIQDYDFNKVIGFKTPGEYGALSGYVLSDGNGLFGVPIDVYDSLGNPMFTVVTDESGYYNIDSIPNGIVNLTIVPPLGYQAEEETKQVGIVGMFSLIDFNLNQLDITPSQRSRGYWAHQMHKALQNKPKHYTTDDFASFAGLIDHHFNQNELNPVDFYSVPQPASQNDSLMVLKKLLHMRNTGDEWEPILKRLAKAQLMALMLNVVSGKVHQTHVITQDGRTISQLITYCDMLVNDEIDPTDNDDWPGYGSPWFRYIYAGFMLVKANLGLTIPAGMIPEDVINIAYKIHNDVPVPEGFELAQNYPNPFNPETEISYSIPEASNVKLEIFNIMGQKVTTLADQHQDAGSYTVRWDSRGSDGNRVSSGIYLYRLTAGEFVETKKMILMK